MTSGLRPRDFSRSYEKGFRIGNTLLAERHWVSSMREEEIGLNAVVSSANPIVVGDDK